jgi:hypothetical protein
MLTMPPAGAFMMYGARAAISGGLFHMEKQVKGIEQAVVEEPGLAFDLAKTIVESTCRAILGDRGVAFEHSDDLPHLFKLVTTSLPILPVTASGEVTARKNLEQTLNGLHTALQGVCVLRNAYGFASHGPGAPQPPMESVRALLAALAADAIVGVLHRVHRQDRGSSSNESLQYDDHGEFNVYVDDRNGEVRIFDLTYRSSEVLFVVDREAYRDLLSDYRPDDVDPEQEIEPEATGGEP